MTREEQKRIENEAKRSAAAELQARITERCLGLDADGWAYRTGIIFGEYFKELSDEAAKLGTATSPDGANKEVPYCVECLNNAVVREASYIINRQALCFEHWRARHGTAEDRR